MQSDLCSAGPNDKTLKVKKSRKAPERVHSKSYNRNRNVKLLLAIREKKKIT